ncbi:helix-turn-helix domain-containing protein [Aureimonas sp. OT7]|nr:helix-turn-helix domain-containing protein [Aureimonas sp. OT7]
MSETATYLRSSRTSLYRMIRRGDVKPIKLGGRTLFRRTDLDALIEQCAEA